MAKEVKIMSVSLNNWRGQTREVRFDGQSAMVSGRNHSGKSSVMNAFLWCVLGFDSEDRSNYLLFDNTVEQTHDNAVPAEVEVVLDVDGTRTALKRVASQGWVRRRGTDTYERNGSDTYTFFLDGIERSARQFEQDIEYTFGAPKDKLKIMLNLSYFMSLDWKTQRKHLGDIIGDVCWDDYNGDYSLIMSELGRFSVEELKEKYKAMLRPLKDSLEKLPVMIDTLKSNLPSQEDIDAAEAERVRVDAEIANVQKMISDKASSVQEYSDRRVRELREIARLEEELDKERRDYLHMIEDDPALMEAEKKLSAVKYENNNIALRKGEDTVTLTRLRSKLKSLMEKSAWHEKERLRLKSIVDEIKAREFTAGICSCCGQPLPGDMVEKARVKFAEDKETQKNNVVVQGKRNNAEWESVKGEIAEIEERIHSLENSVYEPKDTAPLEAEISRIKASRVPYDETVAYKEKMAQIEEKRANLTVIPDINDPELNTKLSELRAKHEEVLRKCGAAAVRENGLKTIESHCKELKQTGINVAQYEGKLNCIAEYEKEKADIIRQRANKYFDYCQVQMETTDKSGNAVPTCIINDKTGVDCRVTNTASQFACRIDIASAFQKFYGVSLPLFADNCEMINAGNMPVFIGQHIELRVSENDFNVLLYGI